MHLLKPELKPRQLRVALAILETGSAARAAARMNLTAAAVLGAISRLEALLDEKLFERTVRGMVPTPAGERFCFRIAAGFAQLTAAEIALHAKKLASRIDNVHLRALLALLEAESFTAAARALGLAQPTLHRAARDLEALAGCTLWERRGRGMGPSWQARLLGQYTGRMQAELRLGLDELAEAKGRRAGRLLIGALPLARTAWLPATLMEMLRCYPKADVDIIDGPYSEQLAALLSGRIDVIMGPLRAPSSELDQRQLFEDPLGIFVRPGHWLRHAPSTEELAALDWILPPRGTPSRAAFDEFLRMQGVSPPPRVISCNSLVTIHALLMRGDYAAVLSVRQVTSEVALGELYQAGPSLDGTAQPVGLTVRADFNPSGLVSMFLDCASNAALRVSGCAAPGLRSSKAKAQLYS